MKSQYQHPARVQTLLFDPERFTLQKARAWARQHGFRANPIEAEEGKMIRLQQFDPGEAIKGTFGTKEIAMGVKAVFAGQKGNPSVETKRLNNGRVVLAKADHVRHVLRKLPWWDMGLSGERPRRKGHRKNPPIPDLFVIAHQNGGIVQLRGSEDHAIDAFDEAMSEAGGSAVLFKVNPSVTIGVKQKLNLVPIAVSGGEIENPQPNHPYLQLKKLHHAGRTWYAVIDKRSRRVRYMSTDRRDAARRAREL